MKPILPMMALLGLVWSGSLELANGQYIWINLSIKAAVNPDDGSYPGGATLADIQQQFDRAIVRANEHHSAYLRGYRYRRVEPVQSIGALGDYDGPGKWSLTHIDSVTGKTDPNYTSVEVVTDPGAYKWNPNAVNIFCYEVPRSNSPPFGYGPEWAFFACSSISNCNVRGETNILVYYAHSWSEGWSLAHESGHFFGLIHTFGGAQCNGASVTNNIPPGDDLVSDTLPEVDCWSRDMIAWNTYHNIYDRMTNQPNREPLELVDNTYFNLMSYHTGLNGEPRDLVTTRLTEQQLDRFSDFASDPDFSRHVVSGATLFVTNSASCFLPDGRSKCGGFLVPGGPFPSVAEAATAANPWGGDILLLRAGNYNERLTIQRPLTLRATRKGWATIGRP